VNPHDYKKILDAMENPEVYSKASKLLKKDYGPVKFYGRRINGKKIVFMETAEEKNYDDYELSIFREIIDPEKQLSSTFTTMKENYKIQEKRYGTIPKLLKLFENTCLTF